MDVFQVFTAGSALWLSAEAIALLISPRLVIALQESRVRDITGLEDYVCRAYGFALLALAGFMLASLLAPAVSDSTDVGMRSLGLQSTGNYYGTAAVLVMTVYHTVDMTHAYVNWYAESATLSIYLLNIIMSGALGCLGVLLLLFGLQQKAVKGSKWLFEPSERRDARKLNRKRL